jgi:hypothetical protein
VNTQMRDMRAQVGRVVTHYAFVLCKCKDIYSQMYSKGLYHKMPLNEIIYVKVLSNITDAP